MIICIVAFLASILTFFSGFGLGTILLPVFAFFFPVEAAIALTGVVHFFNNMFKLTLVGKNANKKVILLFGIPAVIAAYFGAKLLLNLTDLPVIRTYEFLGENYDITLVNVVIGLLLISFAIIELMPFLNRLKVSRRHLPLGGALSGFFGGLSGHQGALRSAFLIHAGLSKVAFIGTAVVISSFIDLTRLSVYSTQILNAGLKDNLPMVLSATLAAMAGAFYGNRLLKKVTFELIHKIVAFLLILVSIGLGLGIL